MNKLEKAIALSKSEDNYSRPYLRSDSEHEYIKQVASMEDENLLSQDELTDRKIIFQGSQQKKVLNSFRDIRTALTEDRTKNVTLVTSINKKSGTSYFAANIAAVTAFDPARTSLLIDCNLENPDVGHRFNIDGPGILDYMYDDTISIDDIIHKVGIERYRCIPAGKYRGSSREYFTHPRFKSLLLALKNRYQNRSIFIDAPPIMSSADTRILLEVCDQAIMIVPFGGVSEKAITSACKIIPKEKIAGVVLNDYIQ